MQNEKNPEALHQVATTLNTAQIAQPEFVNSGTPVNPLVTDKDLPSAEISAQATAQLRANLIK